MSCDGLPAERASVGDYLRLLRVPNVFTALADVSMGYACVHASLRPLPPLLGLMVSSALLYSAGLVLNDVYDVEVDARERPGRPLPSGRISVRRARNLGLTLLVLGVAAGFLAGFLSETAEAWRWRSGVVATFLALCIVGYDARVKNTLAGPVVMGVCRFLNVLLGASLGGSLAGAGGVAGFLPHHLLAAGGIGLYVAGVTWFARREAEESSAGQLLGGTCVMIAGIAVLGLIHRSLPGDWHPVMRVELHWWLLLALLGTTIVRRCLLAVSHPHPLQVQTAVKHGLMSIIILDAAVTLEVSYWYDAVAVLALLVPTLILGRWAYST